MGLCRNLCVPSPDSIRHETVRTVKIDNYCSTCNPPPKGAGKGTMTTQLVYYGALGLVSTAVAFSVNRRLFSNGIVGRVSVLEGTFYFVGIVSLCLGWYF